MMAEHRCQMVLEDDTECGAPATRFIHTTFGYSDYPDIEPWKVQYWLCDKHIRIAAENPSIYMVDGEPIISEVLKEEF